LQVIRVLDGPVVVELMSWAGLPLTSAANRPSALSLELPAGVYGDGLLTLPDVDLADVLTEAIVWDFGQPIGVVGFNAFGDLFLRANEEEAVQYLWLQYGRGRKVAAGLASLEALLGPESSERHKFLEEAAFRVAHSRLGSPPYGSVYTHVPIPGLGGDGDPQRCEIGKLEAYVSIVSQSI